ncbi:MAG: prenyltransferase/squalene oxidase repeat-containing protein [Planctomycetota bacterium]|jgi:hypothetical protein
MSDCKLIEMQQVEYFLDLLDAEETSELKRHLKDCDGCTTHIKTVRGDFQALASWKDQTPRRAAVVELLQVMGIGPDEDLEVVMPGETADTSFADELIADIAQDAPAAPGLLLGPAVSDEERNRILGEFGIDPETGHHAPRERKNRKKIGLEELEARADEAVARRSGRMTKSQADDEWGKLAGTTRIMGDTRGPDKALRRDVEEAAKAATDDAGGADTRSKASSAWEKIKSGRKAADKEEILDAAEAEADKRRSQRWEALTGVTQLGGPSDPAGTGEFKPEIDLSELDEEEEEVEALMGTTILSKPAAGSALVPRYQSTVLRKIKSEDEKVRKMKRAAKHMKARTPAWLIGIGVHVAAAFILLAIVWTVPTLDLPVYEVLPPEEPPPPPDPEVEPEYEDFDELDPTEEQDQPSDEPSEMRETNPITTATSIDPTKKEVKSEPFREPREGRGGGTGGRGGGPLKAVEAGLAWLARHQSPDGSWEWKNHTARCENHAAPKCDHGITLPAGERRNFTPGLSALCTLSFLASAYHHRDVRPDASSDYRARHAKYQANMKAAIAYLLSRQDPDGAIGRKVRGKDAPDQEDAEGYMYNHAICTLALCDAFALTADPDLREPAQRAIDFLQRAQDRQGGWDYFPTGVLPADAKAMNRRYHSRSDLSITGWAVMALKVARSSGLAVKPRTLNGARGFLNAMSQGTNPEPEYAKGWFQGYSKGTVERALKEAEEHDLASRKRKLERILKDLEAGRPAEARRGVAMTSVAAVAGLFLGEPADSPAMKRRLTHMLRLAPSADKLRERRPGIVNHAHTYYYWYHGTLAFWNVDDVQWHQWWDANLKDALLGLQVAEGPAAGSWPPADPVYGDYAGRLYSTSLSILTLEVFYRYSNLAKQDVSDLLADLTYDELRAELERNVQWLRTPRGAVPDQITERTAAAMERLRRATFNVRKEPKQFWKRAETVAGLVQQVALLEPPQVPDTASAAEKAPQEAARTAIPGLRRRAITELGRQRTHYAAGAAAQLVRHYARTDKELAVRALSVLEKRLAKRARPEHRSIIAQVCSDPATPKELNVPGGKAAAAIKRELDKKSKARRGASGDR